MAIHWDMEVSPPPEPLLPWKPAAKKKTVEIVKWSVTLLLRLPQWTCYSAHTEAMNVWTKEDRK